MIHIRTILNAVNIEATDREAELISGERSALFQTIGAAWDKFKEEVEQRAESPIERVFLHALFRQWWLSRDGRWSFEPQVPVGPYRVDVLLSDPVNGRRLAVELDGAEFHSSEKQRAYDAQRDLHLWEKHGIETFRITGAEVWRDPGTAAAEAARAFRVFSHDGWLFRQKHSDEKENR